MSTQLEAALHEADADVAILAKAVACMASIARSPDYCKTAKSGEMVRAADIAIVAMQYHDPLRQRVNYLCDVMNRWAAAIDDPAVEQATWERMLREILSHYSLPQGPNADDAMAHDRETNQRAFVTRGCRAGDVELF